MGQTAVSYETLSDSELAALALARDARAVRLITSRNNQRLYRAAWAVLRNRAEAEDAVQEAYLKAFTGRAAFSGKSALSTWLTRIVINEALERKRAAQRRKRLFAAADVALVEDYRERFMGAGARAHSPEKALLRAEIAKMLEAAIARLPEEFRTVFVLREIEEMSVEETAEALGVPAATVKTRHLRARRRLAHDLDPELKSALAETITFAGADCARMSARTLAALGLQEEGDAP